MNESSKSHILNKLNEPVRFLVFSASLRDTSLNSQLADLAAGVIELHGGKVDLAAMADFDVPSYDQDIQDESGFPSGAEELNRRIMMNDAFVITSHRFFGPYSETRYCQWSIFPTNSGKFLCPSICRIAAASPR